MDGPLDGGGGGVSSGGSSNGSLSTVVSKEDNLVLSSEVSSSSCPNDYELELNLGLSLGCGGGAQVAAAKSTGGAAHRATQFARILTAEDFPSVVSISSSSATKISNNPSCGTKRSAESFSPPRSGVRCPVVGWPPVRTHRMNTLMNQGKSPTAEDCDSTIAKSKTKSVMPEKTDGRNNNDMVKDPKKSLFVKVNMDGIPIGRKVDLNSHSCYKALAQTLDDMFCRPSTCVASGQEQVGVTTPTGSLKLLDDLSDFVLTYEDKEGDWMLVGDVPWEMFILSVKRLKIMKTSEANGLAPISPPRDEGRRIKPI